MVMFNVYYQFSHDNLQMDTEHQIGNSKMQQTAS